MLARIEQLEKKIKKREENAGVAVDDLEVRAGLGSGCVGWWC
jgi:hypothetical protein